MEDRLSASIRTQVFEWLQQQVQEHEDVLPYTLLSAGFYYKGTKVPLLGPQGIFKPKVLKYYPISITTSPNSPYRDTVEENTLHYKYRGTNPRHPDNVRLKDAMQNRIPLIYLHGIIKGRYLTHFPVFITGADDRTLTFRVEADLPTNKIWEQLKEGKAADPMMDEVRRRYATSEVVIRLHQRTFREKVLHAYHEHCAFCRLKHRELLDAAHIIPDSEGGRAEVPNGLSLCKIHHAAFDKNILGINEDYRIEVRQDILEEIDGPMLKYGLQGLHHQKLYLPGSKNNRPGKAYIQKRYENFRNIE